MIPNYQQFMRPFLEIAYKANGEPVKLRDVINQLADRFGLSEEERNATIPSGNQSLLDNRVGWARTYLTKAKLLKTVKRAHFLITERGVQALQDTNSAINNDYLKQFDEFVAFKEQKSEVSECDSQNRIQTSETTNDVTPDEALLDAYKTINESLASDLLSRTRDVTPVFFENLLIDLLLAMGYGGTGEGAALALGKSGDNGIDGVIDQDPLGVDQVYIQAKRYAEGNNVGSSDIRDFYGALSLKKAQKGIFITTSDFTSTAIQTARDLGMRIVLINGKELANLMVRYNIGSRDEQTIYLKKIDEDFFES